MLEAIFEVSGMSLHRFDFAKLYRNRCSRHLHSWKRWGRHLCGGTYSVSCSRQRIHWLSTGLPSLRSCAVELRFVPKMNLFHRENCFFDIYLILYNFCHGFNILRHCGMNFEGSGTASKTFRISQCISCDKPSKVQSFFWSQRYYL